ncbi:glycosyl hydrolase family 18 [Colletotrichum higginsianum]|nr:glycosyl hydrolase family 18 [Colletotrichum higginsianum]
MAISPLDELWDAMGSVNNPAPLVNAEALFNQFKQRLWRGQNPMADTTWRSNDLDNTTPLVGINRAQESLSIIRMGISVFSYVNSDHINSNMAGVILRFQNILRRLDLGLATNGFAITRSENMMLESFHYILMPRIEAGENWVIDRIQEMREDWQAVLTSLGPVPTTGVDPNASYRVEIESLLSALDGLERGADGRMFFDNSLFPAPPL